MIVLLAYLWACVQNFTQLSGSADLYILLFGVVCLAWFDFAMDPTKEQHQILWKSRKKVWRRSWQWLDQLSAKKAWAVHGRSKLTETRQVKRKVKSMFIIFFNIEGDCSQRFCHGRPNSHPQLLCRFTATEWECAKTSPRTSVTKFWLLHHNGASFHTWFSPGNI
jgi:hypothetical protein